MSTIKPYPILFITSNLGGGGAERALVNIINNLDRTIFTPYLALFKKQGVFLGELASDIQVYEIQPEEGNFLTRNWIRLHSIKQLYDQIKPKLIMSIKWQANEVLLIAKKVWNFKVPVIINEQGAPQASLKDDPRRRLLWPIFGWIYTWSDRIIVISEGIANELHQQMHIPSHKIVTISNPIQVNKTKENAINLQFKTSGTPAILAAGRLTPLKNYPLLLRAAALVIQDKPIDVYILGEGSEKSNIEELSTQLGIREHIHLLGFQPNLHQYLSQADIFVLSSNHEGFGNVLVEAMDAGVPVVSTDCPYGPREILEDGKFGLLVPVNDAELLAQAIRKLLDDPDLHSHYAQEGQRRARDFSIDNILLRYKELFLGLLNP